MECLMRCIRCDESYSEDRVPRNLICGHSLCTTCATQCLDDQKMCLECNEKQLANKASDLPINYPLLRLVRSVINKEVDLKDVTVPVFPVGFPSSHPYQDARKCPVHGSPMVFMCICCSTWVCPDCLVVDHPCLPRGSCRVVDLTEAMVQIRKEHERNVELFLKDIEHVRNNLEPEMARHNYCLKYCSCDIRSHNRLIDEIEKQFEELKKKDKSTVDLAMENLRHSSEIAKKTTSPEEITTSCQELLDIQTNLKEYLAEENLKKIPVKQNIIAHLRMELRLVADGKKPVYALLEEEAEKETKWALLTSRDDRLLLYSLRDGRPPNDGLIIPYEFVRELIPEQETTVFFEVGSADELQGRVYVRLFDDTPPARQTILLCSGEKGPSYKNTCFYEYDKKVGLLKGGDYENNDGTGGQSIIHHFDFEEIDLTTIYEKVTGVFAVDELLNTKFHIHLKNVDTYVENIVGRVTEGLDILKAASKLEPVTNLIIRDCGLFIPMRIKHPST